jgi:hypothetical protein
LLIAGLGPEYRLEAGSDPALGLPSALREAGAPSEDRQHGTARHGRDVLVRRALLVVPPEDRLSAESQFEWLGNRVYVLEPDGSAVEGIFFVN